MTIRREDAPKDPLVHDKGGETSERDKLTTRSDYRGNNEREKLAHGGALLQPLELSREEHHRTSPGSRASVDSGRIYAATGLSAFRTQYEIFKIPAHHTQRALGRVNDLRDAGTPRTPAEMDAGTARKFRQLSTVNKEDATAQNSANQWIEQQEEMQSDFNDYMRAREALQAAILKFKGAEQLLRRRALQAQKAGKEGEKAKIDQAADTLVQIVHTSISAGNLMTTLESGFLSSSAAGDDYTETVAKNEDTGKDEVTHKVSRTTAGKKAWELAKQAGGQLNLKNVFIALMGDSKKYAELSAAIARLEGEIQDAGLKAEDLQIEAAKQDLENVKFTIRDKQGSFQTKRATTRDAAQTFGQAMGGGKSTIAVALMAEATQELDLFGGRALQEAHQLNKPAKQVIGWLADHHEQIKAHRQDSYSEFADDAEKVLHAAVDSDRAYKLLQIEAPIWNKTASTWRHFMSDVMGKEFDKDALEERDAPIPSGKK